MTVREEIWKRRSMVPSATVCHQQKRKSNTAELDASLHTPYPSWSCNLSSSVNTSDTRRGMISEIVIDQSDLGVIKNTCGFPSVNIPTPAIWPLSFRQRGASDFQPSVVDSSVLRSIIFPFLYRNPRAPLIPTMTPVLLIHQAWLSPLSKAPKSVILPSAYRNA